MVELHVSASSRALQALIEEIGAAAVSKASDVHRTQLWRYATGRGKPDADQIAKLHRASSGRVAADGWETIAADPATGTRSGAE